MTEPTPTPDAAPEQLAEQAETVAPTVEDIERLTKALEKERELRKGREKELGEFRQQARASMTDTERQIAEAREAAAAEVRTQYGSRLAQTEFRAAAAARNPGYDVAKALKYVNLAGLLGEDGEPDPRAIAAAVADLVPEANTGTPAPPSFDGGTRRAAPAGASFNDLIRQAAGRG